ncbi:MAG: phytoene/squalene synthase family protein [Thermoguttaceae bacterium]
MSDVEASLRYCQNLTKQSRSSFLPSFRLVPRDKQVAMEVLYAFMRQTDDLVDQEDGDEKGGAEKRASDLAEWTRATKEVLGQEIGVVPTFSQLQQHYADLSGTMIFPALKFYLDRFGIPKTAFFDALEGARYDLQPKWSETWADCENYCHKVATSVGLASLAIWGVSEPIDSPNMKELAQKSGLAIQLTNIVRDLREDFQRDRFYLPLSELQKVHLDKSDLSILFNNRSLTNSDDSCRHRCCNPRERLEQFERFLSPVLQRIEECYHRSRELYRLISADSRRSFGMIYDAYFRLFQKIQRDPRIVLSRRVRLSFLEKLQLFFRWSFFPPQEM